MVGEVDFGEISLSGKPFIYVGRAIGMIIIKYDNSINYYPLTKNAFVQFVICCKRASNVTLP